jgi:hypothetical protein
LLGKNGGFMTKRDRCIPTEYVCVYASPDI